MDRNVCRTSSDVSIRRYYFCYLRVRKKRINVEFFFLFFLYFLFSRLFYSDWLLCRVDDGLVMSIKRLILRLPSRKMKKKFNIVKTQKRKRRKVNERSPLDKLLKKYLLYSSLRERHNKI
jgi:hypothetical protein